MDDESKGALSGELSADNATGKVTAKGHIGNAFLRAMGRGAAWLAPGHDAKVKLSQAMVQRLTAKIASGEVLNEQETQFVNMVFEREAIKQMNRLDVSARTNSALLEVDELLRGLPEPETSTTTDTFMRRAEAIAGEIHEEELRELFARVLAGEICKPGAFSIKTLETIRSLDPEVAAAFNRARARAFDCE